MNHPLAIETLKQFRIIINALRQHYRQLEKACGISGAQVWILASISETPGVTVSQLSKKLSIHVSTVSNMLDKLAKAGMVERLRCSHDRRVVNLQLTSKGKTILARAPQPLTGLVPYALEGLPEKVLKRLHGDLAALIKQMNLSEHGGNVDKASADSLLSTLIR